jgi:hypothetical protein
LRATGHLLYGVQGVFLSCYNSELSALVDLIGVRDFNLLSLSVRDVIDYALRLRRVARRSLSEEEAR